MGHPPIYRCLFSLAVAVGAGEGETMTDRWGCKHDWEQEQDDLAKLDLHQDELCEGPGPGLCDYCNAEFEEEEKKQWNKR